AEERPPAEVRRAVLPARLEQRLPPAELGAVRPAHAHLGQLAERTRQRPVHIQRMEAVPAEERAVARCLRMAARAALPAVEDRLVMAPPAQVRVALADLRVAQPGER